MESNREDYKGLANSTQKIRRITEDGRKPHCSNILLMYSDVHDNKQCRTLPIVHRFIFTAAKHWRQDLSHLLTCSTILKRWTCVLLTATSIEGFKAVIDHCHGVIS